MMRPCSPMAARRPVAGPTPAPCCQCCQRATSRASNPRGNFVLAKRGALLAVAIVVAASAVAALAFWFRAGDAKSAALFRRQAAPALYGYEVVTRYPHDPEAFTQGLVYWGDELLYESTGLWGRSSLREVDLATGRVLRRHDLDPRYFGEGIAVIGERIVQLTWQSGVALVYDRGTFELQGELAYPGQGWGLTYDGRQLIMSDGTSTLRFWGAETLEETRRVQVIDGDAPVDRLNELEFVRGEVWANVWQTERIARIDPASGRVVGWIDLAGLLSEPDRAGNTVDVLNGIAYDPDTGRVFVTGKWWPVLYEIRVVRKG